MGEHDSWVCEGCGAAVPADRAMCPGCGRIGGRATPDATPGTTPDVPDVPDVPGGGAWHSTAQVPPPTPSLPPLNVWTPAPVPRPSTKRGGSTVVAVGIVAALLVAAAIVVVALKVTGSDDGGDGRSGSDRAAGTDADGQGHAATTTTTEDPRRRLNRAELTAYCGAQDKAWPEVPPFVAGQPARAEVAWQGAPVVGNGWDGAKEAQPPDPVLGSTVISPAPDGRFTDVEAVRANTRAVACIEYIGPEDTRTPCEYEASGLVAGPYAPRQLARRQWKVTVYELHSGGVLHRGEIWTPADHCPAWVLTERTDEFVTFRLTDAMVADWFATHFAGGKPS